MTFGSLGGRILLAAGPVALMLAWDVLLPWLRERIRQIRQTPAVPLSTPESPAAVPLRSDEATEREPGAVIPVATETDESSPWFISRIFRLRRLAAMHEAQKTWRAARALPHQFIPDWKNDKDYLGLLHDAATRGSFEAMNKLSDYAFRRQAFIEAYYWKLKLEMDGGPIFDFGTKDVLEAWMACGCPTQYRNVMRGFSEKQGMFARSVMRLMAGVDVVKANKRLNKLAAEGNADAQQYLRRGKRKIAEL